MAKSEVTSGICGFKAEIKTSMSGKECSVEIETDCSHIKKMSENMQEVDPLNEISYKSGIPETFKMAAEYLPHAACPVPCGIIKAVEVEAKLALPKDVSITILK